MISYERAPAKVNLSLHVLRRREDGFHDLESLVAFTCLGDTLALDTDGEPGLQLTGPRADGIGPPECNLVLRAARALGECLPDTRSGAFRLIKTLPVAAGIGGGSSDAAAALRLLARANHLSVDDPRLLEAAAATGSDVPVCLGARARMMRGRGEKLGPVLKLPPVFAVLVNPGVAVETKSVFARMGLAPGEAGGVGAHPKIVDGMSFSELIATLKKTRNDMEDAASLLAPVVTHVTAVLAAARGCALARMSGSGATCFGLFENRRQASHAARAIRADRPDWWVKACALR